MSLAERLPLFHGIKDSLARSVKGWNVLFPIAAVALTALCMESGLDDRVRWTTLAHNPFEESPAARFAVFETGVAVPIVCGLVILRGGFRGGKREQTAAGCAVLQAIIVIALITAALKFATGRPVPDSSSGATELHWFAIEREHGWFMWPSGHTSENVGAASALTAFYGRRRAVLLAWLFATLVMGSMLVGCFHWLSDIVAGALIAFPIGRAIGRSFPEVERRRFSRRLKAGSRSEPR